MTANIVKHQAYTQRCLVMWPVKGLLTGHMFSLSN